MHTVGMGRETEIMRGTVIGEDKLTLNYTNASTASWLWLLCISQLMLKGSLIYLFFHSKNILLGLVITFIHSLNSYFFPVLNTF